MARLKTIRPMVATLKPTLTATVQHETPRLRGRAGVKQRHRRMLRTNYMCELCQAKDIITIATVVDHVVPLALGGTDDDSNTRNLCDEHHRQVTAEQFGHSHQPTPERYRRSR
ncbi:HNH endonuclease [Pelagibacterium mangrovi]|uniref:HNH endonuclease n=1 Tax=Pelagibacterium mangrovi TaxID=3119828 RepID=UPI002FC83C24